MSYPTDSDDNPFFDTTPGTFKLRHAAQWTGTPAIFTAHLDEVQDEELIECLPGARPYSTE